ncbi:MAG: ATP-dependent DNA ligase [Ferruginibacter sp.]
MKAFAALVGILATSTKTNDKLNAIREYFAIARDEDKVWVIALFTGRRPKRAVNTALLRQCIMEVTAIPAWLFEECYHTVGDLAETIALLLPEPVIELHVDDHLLSYYMEKFIALVKAGEAIKKDFIIECWAQMTAKESFVFNKLITGGFRIGVSQKLMVNAIAKTTGISPSVIAHRISGNWDPLLIGFDQLLSKENSAADFSKPYPFFLSYAIDGDVQDLGDPALWQAEWKWDGIRGQIIKRNNELYVWSRGEELMTEKFPEYKILEQLLPDGCVIDGEIIGLQPSTGAEKFTVLPFALLQTRIGRKHITKKQLVDAPVGFITYDLLEYNYGDIRHLPLSDRRNKMEEIINKLAGLPIYISPVIKFNDWEELTDLRNLSRDIGSEGLMLKRKDSAYQVGRKRGDWWKWKIDPLTIDAVMIYAQKGHGRRSNLYTDYTFAVKDSGKLIPFAKAYSGLTDKEFAQVDSFVKRNSIEKFGPVRTVKPELVFEIAFEGIAASKRHKSGIALRFPRISRWRKDKTPEDINTLDDLKGILETYNRS